MGWTVGVRFSAGASDDFHTVQTGSEIPLAFYPVGTWSCLLGYKAAGGVKPATQVYSSAVVQKGEAFNYTPLNFFMSWCLVF
jgi:hypothetical protein